MIRKVALIGNPNTGKTSLFNSLTGLNQKVGNYPGVTVDKRTGSYTHNGEKINIIDLPGVYGLNAITEDEKIVSDFLIDKDSDDFPDLFVVIADATNLERSLLIFTQVYDLKLPVLLALNMSDLSTKKGIEIEESKLSSLLGSMPVLKMNARTKEDAAKLKEAIHAYESPEKWQPFVENFKPGESATETEERFKKIDKLLSFTKFHKEAERPEFSQKLDKILIHPIWGYVTFLVILFFLFQLIFEVANWPMELIDSGFGRMANYLNGTLPPGLLTDLLVEGIVPGLGGVIIFIPQIALLFLFLSLLEESGYMTRVVFLMDRIMRPFGLHGKSVVPMISGMACAIPAVMAARTIDQPKDRLITILVTPLMSCSARLPVYALMIALVIPKTYVFGAFNVQGLVLLGLYLLGLLAALFAAVIFKIFIKPKAPSFLIMEMPSYKLPLFKNVASSLLEKVQVFVWGAGKIILAISIILWVLGSYGPNSFDSSTEKMVVKVELDESYIGILGKQIEPVIAPLGYDWKIGIALITSFAAREVFVGTMATIYNVGEDFEADDSLMKTMKSEVNPRTGTKVFSMATGLSLMVFYAFAMQCMSTLAIVKRETKTWKWPMVQLVYMTAMAYVGAWITFILAS
ncbi:MAG: ferrous iron transport protein B [Cyclobacteriaceae bacterium]